MILKKSLPLSDKTIHIAGSKSISNRLLILNQFFDRIKLRNVSTSEDTTVLKKALESNSGLIDIHHAGTAMRFLTSYFAVQNGKEVVLTGSSRMKQRPISPLVSALRTLGAEIKYLENENFPPLKIVGREIKNNMVDIDANVSSQFITSLLLIAPKINGGLTIKLSGKITSRPYLDMTLKILKDLGIRTTFNNNSITVEQYNGNNEQLKYFDIESDWSSASYFYSFAAIAKSSLKLTSFHNDSLQGDAVIKKLYWDFFGINTISDSAENSLFLSPQKNFTYPEKIELDMNDCPDIAQTLCVSAAAHQIHFNLTGLKTLKIKETDRLTALKAELEKLGCITKITEDGIYSLSYRQPDSNIKINTYEDHRMAMSFAPFCLVQSIEIESPEVVNKSYPEFWDHFNTLIKPLT